MNLRFFKKLNGDKILQAYDLARDEYMDVPMVEESSKQRLLNALHAAEKADRSSTFTILLSDRFHECLKMEEQGLYSKVCRDISSIYGHRIYVARVMSDDFKICKEL